MASEHEHSNCILLAHKKVRFFLSHSRVAKTFFPSSPFVWNVMGLSFCLQFKVDGEWWTWIDYEKFQQLVRAHDSSNGAETFTSADYMAKTPSWAVYGCKERGFDPEEVRFHRKNKKDISGC